MWTRQAPPPFTPIPGLPDDQFSYTWAGGNDSYDVLLNVYKGRLNGLITGSQKRYGIELGSEGGYNFIDVRAAGYPSEDIASLNSDYTLKTLLPENDQSSVSDLKVHVLDEFEDLSRGTSLDIIDVLVVWTEQARIDAGGAVGNPNDTLGIEALMMMSIEHANLIFSNSETNTRITKFSTSKFSGFTPANPGNSSADRDAFVQLSAVNALRNTVGADIVTGIIRDNVNYCGAAFVQSHPTCEHISVPGCSDLNFNPFAYNIVSRFCAVLDDTFTHEIGHLMGANHAPIEPPPNAGAQLPPGWINAVSNNGYPYAFGTLDPNIFASIMSINFNTPRRMYFSNPDVIVSGVATGNVAQRDNARVIDTLAPDMVGYRDRPDLIFVDGFE